MRGSLDSRARNEWFKRFYCSEIFFNDFIYVSFVSCESVSKKCQYVRVFSAA